MQSTINSPLDQEKRTNHRCPSIPFGNNIRSKHPAKWLIDNDSHGTSQQLEFSWVNIKEMHASAKDMAAVNT